MERYVETKYELTPTDVMVSFSPDGMNSAFVSTKEFSFSFQVYVSRDTKKVWDDLYLESMSEYYLEKYINEKADLGGEGDKIRVVLESRFSKNNPVLTVEDINNNPEVLLNTPSIVYFCYADNVEVGSEESYLIFNQITKYLRPTSIHFTWSENGKKVSVFIRERDFYKIHDKKDLIAYAVVM